MTEPHNITWLDDALVTEAKLTEAPLNRSHSGYGGKIPTRFMVKYNHRWHRVYMMQYGNAGTPYIVSRRAHLVLSNAAETLIENLVKGGGPHPTKGSS